MTDSYTIIVEIFALGRILWSLRWGYLSLFDTYTPRPGYSPIGLACNNFQLNRDILAAAPKRIWSVNHQHEVSLVILPHIILILTDEWEGGALIYQWGRKIRESTINIFPWINWIMWPKPRGEMKDNLPQLLSLPLPLCLQHPKLTARQPITWLSALVLQVTLPQVGHQAGACGM